MRATVKVKPKSGRSEIISEGDSYVAYLRSEPEKGKANEELIKIARKFFGRPVKIKSGFTSKTKIVEF